MSGIPDGPAGGGVDGVADLRPVARAREQRAWYWYDWANSAYTTTIGTVFFGPYFINLAENAVGEEGRFDFLTFSLPPGALFFWLITISTILSALLLPPLGAFADRTENKKGLLGVFAWTGALFATLIFFATGDNWLLAAVGIVGGNLCFGAAGVINDSILPLISTEDERDHVSSRGWAFGYLGGGLLLALNLAVFLGHEAIGLERGTGRPAVHALGRVVVGRVHPHPVPAAEQPPAGARRPRERRGHCARASASSGRP